MSVIVTIKTDHNPLEWMARLDALNVSYSRFASFPLIFSLPDVEPEFFDLDDWPEILDIEDSGKRLGTTVQSLNFYENWVGGNWGLARHTKRDLPWARLGLKLPSSSTFHATRDGTGVDIYVVDSGVEIAHPEFSGRATILFEHEDTAGIGDNNGHGTAVAACAAGINIGFARAALIWSCKCLDGATNTGSIANILSAIDAAITHYNGRARPAVINLSLTGSSTSLSTAVSNATTVGIVVVVAAGNDRSDLDSAYQAYPAESDYSITVGASTPADTPADFTNFGTRVDINAAGAMVHTAHLRSITEYAVWNGTSFASPMVAGAVACILQDYQKLTSNTQTQLVKNYLRQVATWGKLNITSTMLPLPNALLYMEPTSEYPMITGLTPNA